MESWNLRLAKFERRRADDRARQAARRPFLAAGAVAAAILGIGRLLGWF